MGMSCGRFSGRVTDGLRTGATCELASHGLHGHHFSTLKNSDEDNIIYKAGYIRVIRSFKTASVASGNIVVEQRRLYGFPEQ